MRSLPFTDRLLVCSVTSCPLMPWIMGLGDALSSCLLSYPLLLSNDISSSIQNVRRVTHMTNYPTSCCTLEIDRDRCFLSDTGPMPRERDGEDASDSLLRLAVLDIEWLSLRPAAPTLPIASRVLAPGFLSVSLPRKSKRSRILLITTYRE